MYRDKLQLYELLVTLQGRLDWTKGFPEKLRSILLRSSNFLVNMVCHKKVSQMSALFVFAGTLPLGSFFTRLYFMKYYETGFSVLENKLKYF